MRDEAVVGPLHPVGATPHQSGSGVEAEDNRQLHLASAVGTAGFTSLVAAIATFYNFFLTDIALVPPTMVALAVLAGKLWDAVNDPLAGVALDRLRSKIPLRHWLTALAVPLGLAASAVWWVPAGLSSGWRVLWVVGTYLIFDTLFSLANLGFSSLNAEAATTYDGRTRLMAFGAVGAVVGQIIGSVVFRLCGRVFETPAFAYAAAGVTMGTLIGLGTAFAAARMPERPVPAQPTPDLRRMLWALRQRPFFFLVSAVFFARIGLTLVSAIVPYFAKYVMGDEALAASLMVMLMGVVVVFVPFWRWLANRWSKSRAYAVALAVSAVAFATTWAQKQGVTLATMTPSIVLIGVGMAGHWVLPWSLVPDVVDWDEAETGERRVGLYYALYGLVDKLARTLGLAAIGWYLGVSGFVANSTQSAQSLDAIRMLFGPAPAVLLMVSLPMLFLYPIGRQAHARIVLTLEGRRREAAP